MPRLDILEDTECEFCGYPQDFCYSSPIGYYCINCWTMIKNIAEVAIEELEEEKERRKC